MNTLTLTQKISLSIFGFIAASFGGWIYEEICIFVLYHHLYNRGMLHLPICPIYGFGAWGLWLLLHRVKNTGAFFALSVIIASAFEFGCSYLLEFRQPHFACQQHDLRAARGHLRENHTALSDKSRQKGQRDDLVREQPCGGLSCVRGLSAGSQQYVMQTF